MKKRMLLLAIVGLLAIACSAQAVTTGSVSQQLYGQFNQIAAPMIPFDPNPRNVVVPSGVFGGWQGLLVSDYAQWLEPTSQSLVSFPNDWDNFPNVLMGDGYLCWTDAEMGIPTALLQYDGVDISDTEAWLSLPGMTGSNGGWHYVGVPYLATKGCLFYDIVVTDGTESHTMMDFILNGTDWMSLTFIGLDAPSQSVIGIPDSGDYLVGGQMYLVETYKNNLALILPLPTDL
ncbi:MAG: hypothetical protein Q7T82_17760 [Armatimonadota bacterium]|nr:hypothetical protein [Armatimonadota bacterium]